MANSIRHMAKRKLMQAKNCIDTALNYIAEVEKTYDPDYPLVAEPLQDLGQSLIFASEFIDRVEKSF